MAWDGMGLLVVFLFCPSCIGFLYGPGKGARGGGEFGRNRLQWDWMVIGMGGESLLDHTCIHHQLRVSLVFAQPATLYYETNVMK